MDFKSLEGKKISAYHYFDTLTQLGWKYDIDESDLFQMLSKTFWENGFKVSLILKEYCCVPPQNEETTIQSIDFFTFDKKEFKEKHIETYADLNTVDYKLLQAIKLTDVPTAIQKEVWDDLCLCEI